MNAARNNLPISQRSGSWLFALALLFSFGVWPAVGDGLLVHRHGGLGAHPHPISATGDVVHGHAHGPAHDEWQFHHDEVVSCVSLAWAADTVDFQVVLVLPTLASGIEYQTGSTCEQIRLHLPLRPVRLMAVFGDLRPPPAITNLSADPPSRPGCARIAALLRSNHALLL